MVKDKAEVIVIYYHFRFQYFFELKMYIKKKKPELFYLFSDSEFVYKLREMIFRNRVSLA